MQPTQSSPITSHSRHPHQDFLINLYKSPLFRCSIEKNVAAALTEDLAQGDIHTFLYEATQTSQAQVISRENAIMCGTAWVNSTFRQISDDVGIQWHVQDGDTITPNQVLFDIQGPTAALLSGERTALNFLQLLMGTATQCASLQTIIAHTKTHILDTRKTIPGLRLAQKYAIACAGGANHRIGLWDAFLIKENHILAAGGIQEAVHKARHASPKTFLEVEVETLDELESALNAQVDRILLDNFSLEQLKAAVTRRDAKAQHLQCDLEASGNVNAGTIASIAETGVDYISVGAITKNVLAADLSFRIIKTSETN